jgi:hypothetical protein
VAKIVAGQKFFLLQMSARIHPAVQGADDFQPCAPKLPGP